MQVPLRHAGHHPHNLPLFGHEARHNVYHDVFIAISLEDEPASIPDSAHLEAAKDGTLEFVSPTIKGRRNLPTEQLMAKR
ncbi:MAG: hypothetical protein IPI39_26025 [Candidatus Obscuribacter sp.]|nr:hypothetical protein [Candidatus Obscuribacter sp.]